MARAIISDRRHPCEVTANRIADHLDKYGARLTGADRDLLSQARHLLEGIASGRVAAS